MILGCLTNSCWIIEPWKPLTDLKSQSTEETTTRKVWRFWFLNVNDKRIEVVWNNWSTCPSIRNCEATRERSQKFGSIHSTEVRSNLLSISYNMIDLAGVVSCKFTVNHMEPSAKIIKYSLKQRIEFPLVHRANQNRTDTLNCQEQQKQRYLHMQPLRKVIWHQHIWILNILMSQLRNSWQPWKLNPEEKLPPPLRQPKELPQQQPQRRPQLLSTGQETVCCWNQQINWWDWYFRQKQLEFVVQGLTKSGSRWSSSPSFLVHIIHLLLSRKRIWNSMQTKS